MPRQANGNYLPPANTAAVSGQSISSVAFNTLETDIGTEITNSVDRGGRSAMTAALPMGGQKITGMADPTVATDGATKNYVDTTTAAFFSTGDIKPTFKNAADAGWLLMDDGTFGSTSSGSSNRANADTQALFNLFFANMTDANAPLLTSGGAATTRAAQTNAATAWAANCRMTIPKSIGHVFGNAMNGSNGGTSGGVGLTARPLGSDVGAENHTLTAAQIPTITSAGTNSITVTTVQKVINGPNAGSSVGGGTQISASDPGSGGALSLLNSTGNNPISVTSNNTAGQPHNNMQPSTFVNWMVKL